MFFESVVLGRDRPKGDSSLDLLLAIVLLETMVWFVGVAIGVQLHGKITAGKKDPAQSSIEHPSN